MQLLLIRHAPAVERDEFANTGEDDTKRPLTADGRRKMRRIARGLHRWVSSIDLIGTSSLVRAQETAAILAAEYGEVETTEVDALSPDAPTSALLRWLAERREATIALVGHEPDLGRHASWLLAARRRPFVTFRKGGACLLEIDSNPRAGSAMLLGSIPPSAWREIGGKGGKK